MTISGYHAHVYFDATSLQQASALCEQASTQFDLSMGRVHQKLVGPHPCWSCQLAFAPELFAHIIPWLMQKRDGLVVFVHPNTGNNLRDHTEYAMWLGASQQLKLSVFSKQS